jgi:L-aminopeptidase/D-esterase-like protein
MSMRNSLTDVTGVRVGNGEDPAICTGVTVVMFDQPAVTSAAVLGGAPGGLDLDALEPDKLVERIDAIVLSGGSAFGLEAASGTQAWLREHGRGLTVGSQRVPIVPAAICFDLLNGGDKKWGRYPPYRELAYAATATAGLDFELGSVGAGYGATTVTLKGGLGTASTRTSQGLTIAAIAVINSLGSAVIGDGPHFWAAPFEVGSEFGGLGWPSAIPNEARRLAWKGRGQPATTLCVVATDATLTKSQAKRLAIAAHDGYARALRIAHALFDGDIVFAAATGARPLPTDALNSQIELGICAADCVARAIARGVYEASRPGASYAGPPTWRERFRQS